MNSAIKSRFEKNYCSLMFTCFHLLQSSSINIQKKKELENKRVRSGKRKGVVYIQILRQRERERGGGQCRLQRLKERERERRELIIVSGFYIIGTCCNGNLSVHVLHDHLNFKGKEQFFTYNDLKPMNCERRREN